MYKKIKKLILFGIIFALNGEASVNDVINDEMLSSLIENIPLERHYSESIYFNLDKKLDGYTPSVNDSIDFSQSDYCQNRNCFEVCKNSAPSIEKKNEMSAFISFATHALIILPENDVNDSSTRSVLDEILRSGCWCLFSSTMLKMFKNSYPQEYKKSIEKYSFFALPKALESKGKAYILAIPNAAMWGDAEEKDILIGPDSFKEFEKKLGLRVGDFEYLGMGNSFIKDDLILVKQEKKVITQELERTLNKLFVAKNLYSSDKEAPRWILVFDGHGAKSKLYDGLPDLTTGSVVKKRKRLAGILVENIGGMINTITQYINLMHVHFFSCYGGTLALAELVNTLVKNEPIITSMAYSGYQSLFSAEKKDQYASFLKILLSMNIKKTWTLKNEKLQNVFVDVFTNAVKNLLLDNAREVATSTLASGKKGYSIDSDCKYSIPCIKFPEKPFMPVPYKGVVKICTHKDFFCGPIKNDGLNTELQNNETPEKSIILCDGTPVKMVVANDFLMEKKDKKKIISYPYFLAGTSESFFQYIETFIVPTRFKKFRFVLEAFFPEFFKAEGSQTWSIFIKNVMNKKKNLGSLRATGNNNRLIALFSRKNTWFFIKEKNKKNILRKCCQTLPEKNFVEKWLKIFEEERIYREKRALLINKFLELSIKKSILIKKPIFNEEEQEDTVFEYPKFP